jgi:hypothetical protein
MASTRNRNTREDYCMEQSINRQLSNYLSFENASYGKATQTSFPGDCVNMGKMPAEVLSQNSVDIESTLFGIGSTNLVNPKAPTQAKLYKIDTKPFMDRMFVAYPEPLVVENNQRPFPCP